MHAMLIPVLLWLVGLPLMFFAVALVYPPFLRRRIARRPLHVTAECLLRPAADEGGHRPSVAKVVELTKPFGRA
jgi:hypothetical protein